MHNAIAMHDISMKYNMKKHDPRIKTTVGSSDHSNININAQQVEDCHRWGTCYMWLVRTLKNDSKWQLK